MIATPNDAAEIQDLLPLTFEVSPVVLPVFSKQLTYSGAIHIVSAFL
ncbi:MAG: hypothetical protein V4592_16065 [Bacteroidota bacterium]